MKYKENKMPGYDKKKEEKSVRFADQRQNSHRHSKPSDRNTDDMRVYRIIYAKI